MKSIALGKTAARSCYIITVVIVSSLHFGCGRQPENKNTQASTDTGSTQTPQPPPQPAKSQNPIAREWSWLDNRNYSFGAGPMIFYSLHINEDGSAIYSKIVGNPSITSATAPVEKFEFKWAVNPNPPTTGQSFNLSGEITKVEAVHVGSKLVVGASISCKGTLGKTPDGTLDRIAIQCDPLVSAGDHTTIDGGLELTLTRKPN